MDKIKLNFAISLLRMNLKHHKKNVRQFKRFFKKSSNNYFKRRLRYHERKCLQLNSAIQILKFNQWKKKQK